MDVFIGKVWLNEDWEGESYRDYMEVSSLNDSKDTLDGRLIELNGKTVKFTMEIID